MADGGSRPGDAYDAAVARYGKDDYPRVSGPWFDQFPPAPDGWEHPQWCWRHWAACPLLGGNGIMASLLVMEATVHGAVDAHHAQAKMDPALGKMCCRLGDARMYEVWRDCPPGGEVPEHGAMTFPSEPGGAG